MGSQFDGTFYIYNKNTKELLSGFSESLTDGSVADMIIFSAENQPPGTSEWTKVMLQCNRLLIAAY